MKNRYNIILYLGILGGILLGILAAKMNAPPDLICFPAEDTPFDVFYPDGRLVHVTEGLILNESFPYSPSQPGRLR